MKTNPKANKALTAVAIIGGLLVLAYFALRSRSAAGSDDNRSNRVFVIPGSGGGSVGLNVSDSAPTQPGGQPQGEVKTPLLPFLRRPLPNNVPAPSKKNPFFGGLNPGPVSPADGGTPRGGGSLRSGPGSAEFPGGIAGGTIVIGNRTANPPAVNRQPFTKEIDVKPIGVIRPAANIARKSLGAGGIVNF